MADELCGCSVTGVIREAVVRLVGLGVGCFASGLVQRDCLVTAFICCLVMVVVVAVCRLLSFVAW